MAKNNEVRMREMNRYFLVGLAAFFFFLPACTTTYQADNHLNTKFSLPTPADDETNVFVIRGNEALGRSRGVWIGLNDKVIGVLENRSHFMVKMPAGINTINAVMALEGFAYTPVDNRRGETVFLVLNFNDKTFSEVNSDLGKTMVMTTAPFVVSKAPRPNTGYDEGILNPGRILSDLMVDGHEKLEPDANSAVVTFMRAGKLLPRKAFDLWDEVGYVGSLCSGEYLQVRTAPGRHVYIAKSGPYEVLKADLAAGKHYYVDLNLAMAMDQAHVELTPLDPKNDRLKVMAESWLKLRLFNDAALGRESVSKRLADGNRYLSAMRDKIAKNKISASELSADQGK
jgi:hypothetical protein